MQKLNSIVDIVKFKKGGLIARWLPFFILTACADFSHCGKVVQNNSMNKDSFIFSVSEEYLEENKKSKIDKNHPKMTKSESRLLKYILKEQGYCINEDNKIAFRINSRQEKIYDMTFAYLIAESYNARPVTPRMYYGECVNKNTSMTKEEMLKKLKDEVGKLN